MTEKQIKTPVRKKTPWYDPSTPPAVQKAQHENNVKHQMWKCFTEETTLHGLKYLYGTSIVRK